MMINNALDNDPAIVVVKPASKIRWLFSKVFGLALHISILIAGTNLAEAAWQAWRAC